MTAANRVCAWTGYMCARECGGRGAQLGRVGRVVVACVRACVCVRAQAHCEGMVLQRSRCNDLATDVSALPTLFGRVLCVKKIPQRRLFLQRLRVVGGHMSHIRKFFRPSHLYTHIRCLPSPSCMTVAPYACSLARLLACLLAYLLACLFEPESAQPHSSAAVPDLRRRRSRFTAAPKPCSRARIL